MPSGRKTKSQLGEGSAPRHAVTWLQISRLSPTRAKRPGNARWGRRGARSQYFLLNSVSTALPPAGHCIAKWKGGIPLLHLELLPTATFSFPTDLPPTLAGHRGRWPGGQSWGVRGSGWLGPWFPSAPGAASGRRTLALGGRLNHG